MKLFATFTKAEEQDDGTLMVEGIASTEAVDAQGEIVKSSAIEAALPDYMRHGTGALREMHQPLAAGTAMASVAGDVTTIKAHVVDPVAVKKVQTGVYKGFSIGGKVTERDSVNKSTITGLKLVEISLVDRPANPDAILTMWKADDLGDDTGGETIAKSLYDAAWLADILAQLKSLQGCAEWNAAIEGDGSPIPAQLKEAVNGLADILVGMVKEEIAEGDGETTVVIEAADVSADLTKVDEPAPPPAAEPIVEAPVEPVAKVEDLIAKAIAAAIEPLTTVNTKLAAEIAGLKANPAAPKGAVMAVGKVEDAGGKVEEIEPVRKSDGSADDIASEIKKIHRGGSL